METIIIDYATKALYAVLVFAIGAVYRKVNKLQKEAQRKNSALESGVQSLLRDRIIQSCSKYHEKGYAPVYAKENVTAMYNSYHNLGANGTITGLYKDFMELPTQQERK